MVWTLADVPDLSGKVVAITGATSGVGFHAARTLAHNGAKVVMMCRNVEKMASVASAISSEKSSDIVQLQCDVSDLESVRACSEAFKNTAISQIDVLMLNAGIMSEQFKKSAQDIELIFATNHLGHWLLAGLLLDYVKNVEHSRIIITSSLAHRSGKGVDYDVVKCVTPERFHGMDMYSATKLANLLMVWSLNRKLATAGAKTIAIGVHPGVSYSGLTPPNPGLMLRFVMMLMSPLMQTSEQGSWPLVMAATDPNASVENYYGPSRMMETFGAPISNAHKNATALDEKKADELWAISEELTGFKYSI